MSDVITSIGEVILFRKTRDYAKAKCQHRSIIIDDELSTIECSDCHEKLNPVLWLQSMSRYLNQRAKTINRRLAQGQLIQEKLETKGKFLCAKCGDINQINLQGLISNKAIEARMCVLAADDDGGAA
jgi:ribosomal protein S27E